MTRLTYSAIMVLLIISLAGCATATVPAASSVPTQTQTKIPDTQTPVPPTPLPPTATATFTPVPPTAVPTSTLPPIVSLNSGQTNVPVFSAPDPSSARVGWLKPGDQVAAFGMTPRQDWIEIGFSLGPANKAWVPTTMVSLNTNTLPVIVPTGEPVTPTAIVSATAQTQARPEAIAAIAGFLHQQTFSYKYLGQSSYLNNPKRTVDQYQVNGTVFSVDLQTNLLLEIDATQNSHSPSVTKQYTPDDLQQMAITLIHQQAPGVDLTKLTPNPGSKINNYFFRWEEQNPYGFIQVGITIYGELLNYDNALNDPVNGKAG
jgi:hypothetical protein